MHGHSRLLSTLRIREEVLFMPCRAADKELKMADKNKTIDDLNRIIKLIKTDVEDIPAEEKKKMVAETLDHFNNYVSPGWLKYRKSVSSDSDDGAVQIGRAHV